MWRANSHNEGKLYAIVEAKASKSKTSPSYIKTDKSRKPSISSRLGVNGIPKAEEILDPPTEDGAVSPAATPAGGGRAGRGRATTTPVATIPKASADKKIIVQMSHEWIENNLEKAVGKLKRDVLVNYSRHLFYTPLWLPSAISHGKAYLNNSKADAHSNHDIASQLCYQESDVKLAVNKKKEKLRKKFGNLLSLKAEL